MLRKFLEGLVFGSGFGVSFIVVWYLAAFLVSPRLMHKISYEQPSELGAIRPPPSEDVVGESTPPYYELSVDEKIKSATVIALAKYERGPDGQMQAIIQEFLKKDPGVTIYYDVGDEFPSSSYYPKENTLYGDGVLIFFTGSPATMQMSMTYTGDRIRSLGDMPMELFRRKCED